MKRPQLNGNKLVTRYSDTTSLALRNYIDISSQRLHKVRAGKHLTTVLKRNTPSLLRSQPPPESYNVEKDPVSLNGFSSHRSDKPSTAAGTGKPIVLSEFMGTYLTQKNIDEDLLAKKEGNIYQFFKEKFSLMGKYLGEDVLKSGLVGKPQSHEGGEIKAKKHKNLDHENRDQYRPGHSKDEKGAANDIEGPAAKILNINKEVMSLILKQEHDMEMAALMNLQTEQNMQVFNDLQDVGLRDSHKKTNSAALARSPPSKVILKNNFLRTFVDIGTDYHSISPDKHSSMGYRSSKKKHTSAGLRPQTEYLVFRTQKKKETIAPDMAKMSDQFDAHKFGKKAVINNMHIPRNASSSNGLDSMYTEDELKLTDKLGVPRQISLSNIQTSQISVESTRNRNRYDAGNYSTTKSVKALIGEEIEFLNNNREQAMPRANTAVGALRVPNRFMEQVYQTENKVAPNNQDGEPKEVMSYRETQTKEDKRHASSETKKGMSVSKSQTKLSTGLFEDGNGSLQGVRIVKQNMTHLSPKLEMVPLKAVQGPVMNAQVALKRDIRNAIANQKSAMGLDSLIGVSSEKMNSFGSKLVPVKRDETCLPMDDVLTGVSSVKTTSKGFIFDSKSANSSGLLTKKNFGNKYWRNTFND